MRELSARVRAEGLDDDTAKSLPTMLDAKFLGGMEISTWRTDAGDFDVLTDMPNQLGIRLRYEDLVGRAERHRIGNIDVTVASLEDIIASKEWANRPKDHRALPELRAIARSRPASQAAQSHGPDPPAATVTPAPADRSVAESILDQWNAPNPPQQASPSPTAEFDL